MFAISLPAPQLWAVQEFDLSNLTLTLGKIPGTCVVDMCSTIELN